MTENYRDVNIFSGKTEQLFYKSLQTINFKNKLTSRIKHNTKILIFLFFYY